ncbi:MAG: DUF202 domain-containing protein [Streptosporangiaceae bacterium]|nr:DUF202 domain-containing protein [Streptosporangiaceae bacterium]
MTPARHGGDPGKRGPGLSRERTSLARERTSLAWMRTAISFAALGGAVLKVNVVTGLIILGIAPLIWQLGRISSRRPPADGMPADGMPADGMPVVGATRIRLITVSVVGVSLLCLLIALFGRGVPTALR